MELKEKEMEMEAEAEAEAVVEVECSRSKRGAINLLIVGSVRVSQRSRLRLRTLAWVYGGGNSTGRAGAGEREGGLEVCEVAAEVTVPRPRN